MGEGGESAGGGRCPGLAGVTVQHGRGPSSLELPLIHSQIGLVSGDYTTALRKPPKLASPVTGASNDGHNQGT